MSINVDDLPEVEFVSADKEAVVDYVMQVYTAITGTTLAKADPRRIFILVMANVIIMLLNKINYVGKQNMLKYAEGANLDNIAAPLIERLAGDAATLTEQFSLSEALSFNVVVPQGTRVSDGSQVYFATDETLVIKAGNTTGTVRCTCQTVGETGNGFSAGQVTTLVDAVPYVASVKNITASEGGADTETDDALRTRTAEAPELLSTAGPYGAYEAMAKAASALITQAKAVSPSAGTVDVYVAMEDGGLPGDELKETVLTYMSAESRRPFTDNVNIKTPVVTQYDVNLTYYLSDDSNVEATRSNIEAAIQDYVTWQNAKLGRDIIPDKLVQLCLAAGAKRCEITAPVYTPIPDGSYSDDYIVGIAQNSGTVTINYGGVENE